MLEPLQAQYSNSNSTNLEIITLVEDQQLQHVVVDLKSESDKSMYIRKWVG
jgi:hypothetical protein